MWRAILYAGMKKGSKETVRYSEVDKATSHFVLEHENTLFVAGEGDTKEEAVSVARLSLRRHLDQEIFFLQELINKYC